MDTFTCLKQRLEFSASFDIGLFRNSREYTRKISFCPQITPVELQSLVYVKMEKIGDVISTEGRNPTEPMEPEFQAFREDEISPFAALRSK